MKFKKFLAPLLAAAITASAMPVSSVSAVGPRVFVDITYEDNEKVRADIIFDNIEPASCGGFHIYIGDGWDFVLDDGDIAGTSNGCKSKSVTLHTQKNGEKGFFITFHGSANYNLNGRFYSFYLEKNENFNSKNADVNVVFQAESQYIYDLIGTYQGTEFISAKTDTAPPMLEAQEYIIGDANNDGRVNAIDASWIRMATTNNKSYTVDTIKYTYKSIFPEANCAAAPDADLDGHINFIDADKISEYYADMSTDEQNNSDIGKREFYEIFE